MATVDPITPAPGAQFNDLLWAIGQAQGKVASISAIIALMAGADGEKQDLLAALAGVEHLVDDVADALEALARDARPKST